MTTYSKKRRLLLDFYKILFRQQPFSAMQTITALTFAKILLFLIISLAPKCVSL